MTPPWESDRASGIGIGTPGSSHLGEPGPVSCLWRSVPSCVKLRMCLPKMRKGACQESGRGVSLWGNIPTLPEAPLASIYSVLGVIIVLFENSSATKIEREILRVWRFPLAPRSVISFSGYRTPSPSPGSVQLKQYAVAPSLSHP